MEENEMREELEAYEEQRREIEELLKENPGDEQLKSLQEEVIEAKNALIDLLNKDKELDMFEIDRKFLASFFCLHSVTFLRRKGNKRICCPKEEKEERI